MTTAFAQGRVQSTGRPAASAEYVLVLDVAGELTDFVKAIERIPGLEFLAEDAQEKLDSDGDFAATDKDGKNHRFDRQLYMLFSNEAAWKQLLALWTRFQNGQQMPYGQAKFAHLFSRLRDLRAWDDGDRLAHTGVLDVWASELQGLSSELIPFEIELWLRDDAARRRRASEELRADLIHSGGEVLDESIRPEMQYHGVLARLPASELLDTVARHEVRWIRTGSVRFFHPAGQVVAPARTDRVVGPGVRPSSGPDPTGLPTLALLDGVPLAGHDLLRDRIRLDDPDGWEATTQASRRLHGTAMASIVLHGDLSDPAAPLRRPLYVRPILRDDAPDWVQNTQEELPRDQLPVDVLHAAITRLFTGEAVAPTVRVIVLAVGDRAAQYVRFISPLARLLDWLSAIHNVLFVVSAGNHAHDLSLPANVDLSKPAELQHEVLRFLQAERGYRRLLAPGESINALTIGAAHADASTAATTPGVVDPIVDPDLPSVASAMGGGVRRSIKPDLLFEGGRQVLREEPTATAKGEKLLSLVTSRRPPGIRLAAPGNPGQLDRTAYDRGTSMATAICGHHAARILEQLDELRAASRVFPDTQLDAVLTKAALSHTAEWGNTGKSIRNADHDTSQARGSKESVSRLVGYGRARPSQALVCDSHRITILAAENISEDDAHTFRFPLPASLSAVTHYRRLTLTLAWLSPINCGHRAYRRAALKVEPQGVPTDFVDRLEADGNGARRGTLQHEILDGARAVPYVTGAAIELVVSCRADAGELIAPVPYALMATLEVPLALQLPIYQQVSQALPVAVRQRV